MHIFLYGPSGSGKSTVGQVLAQSLDLPFVDLDAEIDTVLGYSIAQLITEQGEKTFRDVEGDRLRKVVVGDEKVVALGGGALLREENRALIESTGQVVFLDVEASILAARLSQDKNERPLLAGGLKEKLSALLEHCSEHYASFSLRVDGTKSLEDVTWDIQRLIGRYHLQSMGAGYDVVVQEGGVETLGEMLKIRNLSGSVLVVSDTNVAPIYLNRVFNSLSAADFAASEIIIPAGEKHKNIDTVMSLWQGCLEAGLDRGSTVLALGGGVVSDLAGFVAATFMRGCNWVSVPTTLLAMVDASMGGKTGFDLQEGKNLVGAFYPPRLVLADPDVLSTLPERELRSGMAEVLKHSVIADKELFVLCTQGWDTVNARLPEIVRRGMAVKVKVIKDDPYERGIRAALNLGHTIGHAVELVSKFSLSHGEAVSIGMVAEAQLAERLAIAGSGLSDALVGSLSELGLPVRIPENYDRDQLIRAIKVDKKKAGGVIRFALPVKIGEVKFGIEIENLEDVL